MKNTKLFLLLFVFAPWLLVLVLSGCTQGPANGNQAIDQEAQSEINEADKDGKSADVMDGHIGCQEGEISLDGQCRAAKNNNAKLFGRDVSDLVESEEISGGASGFLARPAGEGEYPGVVMIHEWWGLNDNIREMAQLLASEGYVVFAVDLYGVAAATTSDRARELATAARSDPDRAVADMRAAADYLRENENVSRLASLGWCFGGQHSLLLSLNEPLDATVIYYGQLTSEEEELANIAGPVLGIFGAEDSSIPTSSVRAFEAGLDSLGIENEVYIYDNVGHAFANPSGSNYAAKETRDAWAKTVSFLDSNLKDGEQSEEDAMMEASEPVVFRLQGENFRFVSDSVESPVLRVSRGNRVRIEFTATEGFHDWTIDEFDAATESIPAGETDTVEFTADRSGTFEYYCSVGNHRALGMAGELIVE